MNAVEPEVFYSFDEVPLDLPGHEGDDAIHEPDLGAGYAALLATAGEPRRFAPAAPRRVVAPFVRELRVKKRGQWMHGLDVLAIDRALAYTKPPIRKWRPPFRRYYGPGLADDIRELQKRKGLKVDGVYGEATHRALAPRFKRFELSLLIEEKNRQDPLLKAQREWLAAAMVGYNLRWRIHYTQGPGRMWIVRHRVDVPSELDDASSIWEDCSSFFTGLCYIAGVGDPNGRGYDGLGYTGTLAVKRSNSRRVYLSEIGEKNAIGAAYFYGGGFPYGHITGGVSVTRAISHGSESGPIVVDRGYREINAVWLYRGLGW